MVGQMVSGLSTAFNAVLLWTTNLFNELSAGAYVLGALFAMLAVRFLIYPFLKGSVGTSDRAINNLTDKYSREKRF